MNHKQALEAARQANPLAADSVGPDGFLSMTALLDRIDERDTEMQTQERPKTDSRGLRDQGPRWLIPALAGAAAIILAIVLSALLFVGGSDEPDVIEPAPPSTTLPAAAVRSPLEVTNLYNEATAAGDWQALAALFADTAEIEVQSGSTGETFVETIALAELVPQTPHDWNGDGRIDGFDGLIDDAARVAAHGTTTFVSCTQVESVTVACEEVWEGHAFKTPDLDGAATWTLTVTDGAITRYFLQVFQRPQNPVDTDLVSEYQAWISDNKPELSITELFEDISTLAISPDTVPIHRELVAEWQAELAAEIADRSPLELTDLYNEAVAAGDWAALRALYGDTAEFEVNSEAGETFLERVPLADMTPQTPYDWDGDGLVDGFDGLIDDAARVAAHGTTTFVSCSQVDGATAACQEVWEGHAFSRPDIPHNTWRLTVVDGVISTHVLEVVPRPDDPIDSDLVGEYNTWVSSNRPELEAELFESVLTLAVSPDTVPVHRELVVEWVAQR